MKPLFVALGLLVAAGGCSAPEPRTLIAEFADVGDLVPRSNVQQSDTVVGRVQRIELRDWKARVTMILDDDVRVVQGTRAVVRSTSLLGEKFVDLQSPADLTARTPDLPNHSVIPVERTSKTPELEEVFSQLGSILASGALEDLGAVVTATARIVEGQEENVGRVLDGTAKLIESLAKQREVLASALDNLAQTSATLAGGTETFDRFLVTTSKVGTILASQRQQLDELIVQLDRLGQSGGRLMREHRGDMDRALKALNTIVPQVHAARGQLDTALTKLPRFAKLFAESIPGDYIQIDAH